MLNDILLCAMHEKQNYAYRSWAEASLLRIA
jgi:hypothetical protein